MGRQLQSAPSNGVRAGRQGGARGPFSCMPKNEAMPGAQGVRRSPRRVRGMPGPSAAMKELRPPVRETEEQLSYYLAPPYPPLALTTPFYVQNTHSYPQPCSARTGRYVPKSVARYARNRPFSAGALRAVT